MRRELPAKPNLEHLKSQAKDLLDAHQRGERAALARIRAAVPAFANMSDEALAKAPFALHDAQSAIAREYGAVSWAELRAKVLAAQSEPDAEPASQVQTAVLRTSTGQALPPEVAVAIQEALKQRDAVAAEPTPSQVPVLTVRNAVVFPGAVVPLDISRPSSMAAIDAALASRPALIAMFAQRASDIERPTGDDVHAIGSLCLILHRQALTGGAPTGSAPGGGGAGGGGAAGGPSGPRAWIAVSGIRWVELESIAQFEPYWSAHVVDVSVDRSSDEHDLAALDRKLRERARELAALLPNVPEAARAMVDSIPDPSQVADFVMSHLDAPVADKAAYAAEPQLARRLEQVIAVLDTSLALARQVR